MVIASPAVKAPCGVDADARRPFDKRYEVLEPDAAQHIPPAHTTACPVDRWRARPSSGIQWVRVYAQ